MKKEIYQNLNKQAGECEQTHSGEHEWIYKWSLPDRECYRCKKCGREEIIYK